MSNEENHKEIKDLLRQAVSPVRNAELQRDLWPQMLRKLDERSSHVPWFDWALAAILGAVLLFFPGAIPALLYHL